MRTTFQWKGENEHGEVREIKLNEDNKSEWKEWYQWSDDSLNYFSIMMDIGVQQRNYANFMVKKYRVMMR